MTEQAERERDQPLLPTVEPVLFGKELFTCQMAADDFLKILGIMGGPKEKLRGEKLLSSLTIVPDAPSDRAMALNESASVKTRAKVIFGTADSLQVSESFLLNPACGCHVESVSEARSPIVSGKDFSDIVNDSL